MKKYLCIVMAAMVVLWAASGAFAVVYGASGYENYGYSESTAWEINSAAVLAKVRDDVNSGKNTIVEGGYFKLTKDIDLTSYTNWVPIGVGGTNSLNKDYHFFTGHFDGGGHTIKVNIAKIQLTTEDIPLFECYCALFGVITDSGSVKNLNVEGSVSFAARVHTARHFTGGIAAYLSGGTIENCKFDGSVSTSQLENSTSTIAYAGGIVGYAGRGGFYASYTKQSFAIIKNCKVGSKSATSINTKAYNSSTTNYAYAGGITAYFGDSASQSELSGNWVKADMYAGEYGATGGIFAGRNGLSGKVSNNTEVDPSEEDPDPDPEPEPTPGTASVTITKSSLASGTAGTAYSDTLTAQVTGGSYAVTWTASGLPSWLSLNSSTGALTGTPTSAGSYTFTVIALINTGTVITASKSYTLTIAAASQPSYTLTITKESLASGQVGTAYSDTLTATLSGTAVSPVWSVSSGSLPAGLTLNASTGTITGTPTTEGSYTFTVKASFLDMTASKSYTLTIAAQPTNPPTITKASLASGTVGTYYSDTLTAENTSVGFSVSLWSVSDGNLPPGLSLNRLSGEIAGTPSKAGTYTFTVKIASASQTYTITIAEFIITKASLASGQFGTAYSDTLSATLSGTAVSPAWSVSSGDLPAGLTLNASTGAITGTPTTEGSYTFTVKASFLDFTTSKTYTITIAALPTGIAINVRNFPDAEFSKYVSSKIDKDKDGYLSNEEIASVKEIDIGLSYCYATSSLKGLEHFTSLTSLSLFSMNNLKELDVSKNLALTRLKCYKTKITSLDVSRNTALTEIKCYYNKELTSLNLGSNDALVKLDCYSNSELTTLDVSGCPNLTNLNCHSNKLTTLDISGCSNLVELDCNSNQLTTLDASGCSNLKEMDCHSNKLTTLDISGCSNLVELDCTSNKLITLDISGCPNLKIFKHDDNLQIIDSLTISLTSLPDGTVGTSYAALLTANLPNVTWSATGLPSWLSLNSSTGALTGTPTAAGTYTFTVTAYAGQYISDPKQLTITVSAGNSPEIPQAEDDHPEFNAGHALVLEGQIGVIFFVSLPEEPGTAYTDKNCWVEFDIRGDKSNPPQPLDVSHWLNTNINGVKHYAFVCYINSAQMADPITATLHYGNNQTITQNYSADDYLTSMLARTDFSGVVRDLMAAIKDYGHYVQPMLSNANNWKIGELFLEMKGENVYTADDIENVRTAAKKYEIIRDPGNTGISDVGFALKLGSTTSILLYLDVKPDYTGNVGAYSEGSSENLAVRQQTGQYEYVIEIPDIPAHELNKTNVITVTADGTFEIRVSALSYADTMLNKEGVGMDMKEAVTALYKYYEAAAAYQNSTRR